MGVCINIDGQLTDPDQARISVFDRGFLFGDSVYEVVRTYAGRPFALDRHLDRLERSAGKLQLELPARAWLIEQVRSTVAAAGNPESYVRLIVTRGSGPISLDPTTAVRPLTVVMVKAYEPFPAWMFEKGIRVAIPQVRRMPRSAKDPAAKTGNYLNSVLALGEVRRAGLDDALLLDVHGRVAEATSANVFAVREDGLCTPTLETGLLSGVTREILLEIARTAKLAISECTLLPDELFEADEVMLTSTLREIMPVVEIDGHQIGDGRPGPMYAQLKALFAKRVQAMLA
jgi:branched-chain amino acid aminotransferase